MTDGFRSGVTIPKAIREVEDDGLISKREAVPARELHVSAACRGELREGITVSTATRTASDAIYQISDSLVLLLESLSFHEKKFSTDGRFQGLQPIADAAEFTVESGNTNFRGTPGGNFEKDQGVVPRVNGEHFGYDEESERPASMLADVVPNVSGVRSLESGAGLSEQQHPHFHFANGGSIARGNQGGIGRWAESIDGAMGRFDATGDDGSAPGQAAAREVVFMDRAVAGYQDIMASLAPALDVCLIDGESGGLEQALVFLAVSGSPYDAIHVISHGAQGQFRLGSDDISTATLVEHEAGLTMLGSYLSRTGDILLYGCGVGQGAQGARFLQDLSRLTGADIAASDDATGTAILDGDDELEATAGRVDADAILTQQALDDWGGLLAAGTVSGSNDTAVAYTAALTDASSSIFISSAPSDAVVTSITVAWNVDGNSIPEDISWHIEGPDSYIGDTYSMPVTGDDPSDGYPETSDSDWTIFLSNVAANGTWRFVIQDTFADGGGLDAGRIESWSIEINYDTPLPFTPYFFDARISNQVDGDGDGFARQFDIEFDVDSNILGSYYVKVYEYDAVLPPVFLTQSATFAVEGAVTDWHSVTVNSDTYGLSFGTFEFKLDLYDASTDALVQSLLPTDLVGAGLVQNAELDSEDSPPSDIALTLGVTETGEYGNNFNGHVDADGIVAASFTGTTDDLVLWFTGYDIDTDFEIEVLLNGASLGFLDAGVDNGLSYHNLAITAGQQSPGTNVISFVQAWNPTFKWGLTDILLKPQADIMLTLGVTETGDYGNNFNGQTDADGMVTAAFAGTAENLTLAFTGYDIDSDFELEVLLNGASLGFLAPGVNNGFSQHQLTISAAQQLTGENVITFVQAWNLTFKWGITDILLDVSQETDMTLMPGVTETGEYGNNFNGQSDADGVVTAGFTGTTEDLTLSLTGYDIDTNFEIEVLLNGASLGFLDAGVDNGLSQHQLTITAAQQLVGANVISFVQAWNPTYKWGITDILLDATPPPDVALTLGVTDPGEYGNNFNGQVDLDGVVTAGFTGTAEDLRLSLTGYDIDTDFEIEVLLNGASLGFLDAGVDNGLSQHQLTITAAQQLAGQNVLSFVQAWNPAFKWGITDILLDVAPAPDMVLTPGVTDTGEYGNNFNGTSDADGVVTAGFTGTTNDLTLSFSAYDVDTDFEIEVLLNGASLGFLAPGVNNGLSHHELTITAAEQQVGENYISFVQAWNTAFTWGVTDVLLFDSV